MTTVLSYVRQSRARPGESAETSLSLEQQIAAIEAWAQANGHTLLPPIVDHDETGRTLHRPGMTALRTNAAERPGCIVAVYKYDRFARNVIGQELAVQELEAAGVHVVSITEPAGKLSRQMHGVFAEYMSDQLSERVTAIKERSALRGDYTGGRPAFGYRRAIEETLPDGRVRRVGPCEPDPATVDQARELFDRFVAGESAVIINSTPHQGTPSIAVRFRHQRFRTTLLTAIPRRSIECPDRPRSWRGCHPRPRQSPRDRRQGGIAP